MLRPVKTQFFTKDRTNNFSFLSNIRFQIDGIGLKLPRLTILSERKEVIADINEHLKELSVTWISGEVATGKTHVAYLLASQFPGNTYWLDLSGSSAETWPITFLQNFRAELKIAGNENSLAALDVIFKELPADSLIVLNDLPQISNGSQAQRFLTEIISAVISNGHVLVVTSNLVRDIMSFYIV